MKIVLIGYMGSGKTTVGSLLANHLAYNFYDLDHLIEAHQSMTISEISDAKGPIFFRRLESEVLATALNKTESMVLALGGGTPCYANNMSLINQSDTCISFYLKGSVPFLSTRLFQNKNNRPLVSTIDTEQEMMEFVGKHLFERSEYYLQSQYTIDIEGKSPAAICEEIISKLF